MKRKVTDLIPIRGARGPLSHNHSLWLIAVSIVLSRGLMISVAAKPKP